MRSLLVDDRDIKFVLFDLLKVQGLAQHDRFHEVDAATLATLLDEARKFAENELFPLNRLGDRIGASYADGKVKAVPGTRDVYGAFVAAGWLTPCEDSAWGGSGLPEIIKFATHEVFFAANFPFMCYVNLTHDAAKLIELFGDEQQRRAYLPKMYGGEWTGTMALTEPGAGSDVGAISSCANRQPDGSYRLRGQKIFITNGDHDVADNIVHLVLARIEGAPPGTRGLSIFIVPKVRVNSDGALGLSNDVSCLGIEHKMGLHGSPTTTLAFGERGECQAWLLGAEGAGIKIMFHMMNASRLEVGLWGQGTCSVSYLHALNYARERKQGQGLNGKGPQVPIIRHPDVRRSLLTMKALVEGQRAMLYYCGYAMDQAAIAANPAACQRWLDIVELLIPVCKAYPTENGVAIANDALQLHGGYGYTREYPVEQFLRDAKVACIFEGTTGIQGMDFTLRKLPMKGGKVFQEFLEQMEQLIGPLHRVPGWQPYLEQFRRTRDALAALPVVLAAKAKECETYSLLKATPLLVAVGDLFVACFLLWSARVAEDCLDGLSRQTATPRDELITGNPEAAFLAGKLDSARHFVGNFLPVTDGKIAAMAWGDSSAWQIAEHAF